MDSESEYVAFPDAKGRSQKIQKSGPAAAPSSSLALIGAAAALGFGITLGGMLRHRHAAVPPPQPAVAQTPAAAAAPAPAPIISQAPQAAAASPAPAASSLDLLRIGNSPESRPPDSAVSAADLSGGDSSGLVPPPQASQSAIQQPHVGRTVFTNGSSLWAKTENPAPQALPQAPAQPFVQDAHAAGAVRLAPQPREMPTAHAAPALGFKKTIVYASRGSIATQYGQAPQSMVGNPPLPGVPRSPGGPGSGGGQAGIVKGVPPSAYATPTGILKGIQLNTLGNGPVSLDSWPTARNLVIYEAPWCRFCRESTPAVKQLRDTLARQGIATRIIIGSDKEREVSAFASEYGPDTLLDPQGAVHVHAFPEYMITDQQGNVLRSHFGSSWTQDEALRWAHGESNLGQ